MKPFNLKEHLEHPDWKVVTREGRPVRIVYTELDDSVYPVVAVINNWHAQQFTAGGLFQAGKKTKYDLFFAPEKHERWAIIYKRPLAGSFEIWPGIYADREKAERIREVNLVGAKCSVIKIEWEEEQ